MSSLFKDVITMGILQKYKATFAENEIYHIYNRSNNKEPLFRTDENRLFFLHKFDQYTSAFIGVYGWNLIPNHFHLCVKIKSYDDIINYLLNKDKRNLCMTEKNFLKQKHSTHQLIDNAFQRFFISYSMNFNSTYQRKGNLLHRPFKHILIEKDTQFTQTIIYINANAIKHKLVKRIEDYKWSSYAGIISDKPTRMLRAELLDWFGGKDQFVKIHKEQTKYYYSCDNSIDDD